MREGCPNCDNVLGLRGNNDAIQECTSQVFEGLVTLRDPNTSWVARWQRLNSYVPGTYAVKVTGSVCSPSPLSQAFRRDFEADVLV
jgi:transcription elongation factor SPT4